MKYEIIGIGSALVDITILVEDKFLEEEHLPKGSMTLVSADRSKELQQRFSDKDKILSPGGATANIMSSFAHCGGNSAFIGKIGDDSHGDYFTRATEKSGVSFLSLTSKTPSGVVLTFITPDGERTFATFLGAATEMVPEDLPKNFLNQAPIIHVEAYLVFNKELITHILDTAKENGQKISLDLSSFNVVEDNLAFFEKIVKEKIDILFANEDEALAYTGKGPRESIDLIKDSCETTIVKEGAKGSWLTDNTSDVVFVEAEKINVVDTNGAGDAYAGGVLYGISKKLPLQKAGLIGTKSGALIVSQAGARLTAENANILRKKTEEILRS